jgi:Raf kinase inhibitor-like YbhB/YbcL family protein
VRHLIFALLIISALVLVVPHHALAAEKKTMLAISSPTFKHNESIPKKYTCDGENISPPLKIKNIPMNAKSLALILDDPDAPGGTFTHWIAWHISPKKTQISEGEKGKISEGLNGLGQKGYFGPCPPSGTHHYHFKLYALDSDVDISEKSKKKDLLIAMKSHTIQSATLIGTYSRSDR